MMNISGKQINIRSVAMLKSGTRQYNAN